jgi:alkylation response protein AidB-like acyl-CoA dehydrogenase
MDLAEARSDEAAIFASIDRFLERDVRPHVHRLEHDDVYPAEIVARMQQLGLFGATISADYGGLGLSSALYAQIVERIAYVWMSLTGIFNSHLIMAAAVGRFGTDAQKRLFLPRFAAGELRGGLALTEPDCGTDLQAIRTVARREGDHYVVNGTKTWISNGVHGQCFALLVKTDPRAEPRHRGMSLFLAEKGPGFTVSRKLEKLGYKGIDSAELVFENYRVDADRLIGGVEGLGLKHALGGLELGRINVAARGVGLAQAALDEALRYSQIRRTFGKPICQHQAIQLKLADMATQVQAGSRRTRRAPTTAACAAIWRPAWRNCSPARRRSRSRSRRCAFTALTAIPRNFWSSACIATRRCS